MKLNLIEEREVDVRYLHLSVAVRYDDEDIPYDFPLRNGDTWEATIDLQSKHVIGWPDGVQGEITYMKICDEGTYILKDADENEVARKDGYVPNELLPGDYGDYLSLTINGDGLITNWKPDANLSDFEGE